MLAGCHVTAERRVVMDARGEIAVGKGKFGGLVHYDFGDDRKPWSDLADELRAATPDQRAETEIALCEILNSETATYASKQAVCRILRQWGTERSVPTLAKLLRDEDLSHMARFALETMEQPQAGKALRKALRGSSGKIEIGLMGSLGARRDEKAIRAIARRAESRDRDLSRAAILALGRIGGAKAAKALKRSDVLAELEFAREDAYLMCADRMAADGEGACALRIYNEVYAKECPSPVRIAALHGIVSVEGEKAAPALIRLLRSDDAELREAALMFLAHVPGEGVTQLLAAETSTLPPEPRALALVALAARGDATGRPAAVRAAQSVDSRVRAAGIDALGVLGDASDVAMLARAACGEGSEAEAAVKSLGRLNAKGVDEAIMRHIQQDDAKTKAILIPALVSRRPTDAVPLLLKTAQDADASVRSESFKALGALAQDKDVPAMLDLLKETENDSDRTAAEKGASAAGKRMGDPAKRVELFLAAMRDAQPPARASILRLMGEFGGEAALETVRAAVKDKNEIVREGAVRSLADWPDPAPKPILLEQAKSAPTQLHRVLALRGYIRLLGFPGATLKEFETARSLAAGAEEKRMVIATAGGVHEGWILKFLASYLTDNAVREEAGTAIQKVRTALGDAVIHTAVGCPVKLQHAFSPRYSGGGEGALTDGYRAPASLSHGKWQGFEGDDLIATIDLGKEIAVRGLRAGFLEDLGPWIFFPREVEFAVSMDGRSFETVGKVEIPVPTEPREPSIKECAVDAGGKKARYVRMHAKSVGKCPKWHGGAGGKAWIFCDEIQVNPEFTK
jgi:HEAT repeat protein